VGRASSAAPERPGEVAMDRARSTRILVADDEPEILDLLREVRSTWVYPVRPRPR
jgi:hypothetical protein